MNKDYPKNTSSIHSLSLDETPKSKLENLIESFERLSRKVDKEISIILEEPYKKASLYEDDKIYKKKMPPFFRRPINWLIKHPIHSIFLSLASSIGIAMLFTAGGIASLLGACVTFTFVMVGGSAMYHLSKKNMIKNNIKNERLQISEKIEKLEIKLKEKTKEIEDLIKEMQNKKNNFDNIPKLEKKLDAKIETYLKLLNLLNENKSKINLTIEEMKTKKPKFYFHLQTLKIFDLKEIESALILFKKQAKFPNKNLNSSSSLERNTHCKEEKFKSTEDLLGGKNKIDEKNTEEIRKQRLKVFKL